MDVVGASVELVEGSTVVVVSASLPVDWTVVVDVSAAVKGAVGVGTVAMNCDVSVWSAVSRDPVHPQSDKATAALITTIRMCSTIDVQLRWVRWGSRRTPMRREIIRRGPIVDTAAQVSTT